MGPPQARVDEDGSSNSNAFGRLLKGWRGRRGFSQLDLAVAARTTQRHLSFIESGRAKPSREMILRLSTTMGLSLRQQNALMLAAGYAPVWRERDLSAPDLAVVNGALDYMLGQHEPYPAFVIDRCWNLLRANKGALNLTEFLTGAAPPTTPSEPINLAVALLAPDGTPSLHRQLGGGRPPLHTRRAGRCPRRRHGRDGRPAKSVARVAGCPGCLRTTDAIRSPNPGIADSFRPRRNLTPPVYDNRYTWNTTRRDP